MADEVREIDPLTLFSEDIRIPVSGLMYLGQIEETVEFCGHSFGLRTLLPQDKFAIGIVLQPYRNTLVEVDAFQAATIGAALTHVDHDAEFLPAVGPSLESHIRARLGWLGKTFYPPTIDFLWTHQQLLEAKSIAAMQELDSLLPGNQPTTSPPWLASFIAQGGLEDETDGDTPSSTTSSSS